MFAAGEDRLKGGMYGGVLVYTLVVLGMFVIMGGAAIALINRQYRAVVGQEQQEQAFQVAEAGVEYTLWLLDQGLVNLNSPTDISDHEVVDDRQDPPTVIGTFDVAFNDVTLSSTDAVRVTITSVGTDAVLTAAQETIEATIESADGEDFRVTQWNHVQ